MPEMEPFRTLYCDAPWKFGDSLPGTTRGASKNYPCLSVDELKAFPLPPLADDCFLFFWRVSSMVPEAYEIIKAWGFTGKTEIVWRKTYPKSGKEFFGLGHYTRASHEVCVIATKGKPKVKNKSTRSIITSSVRKHSQKPDEMYALIENLCTGPYVELFARQVRDGWSSFGLEVNGEQTTKETYLKSF